jgi:hypothetical protein
MFTQAMKKHRVLKSWIAPAALGLALAGCSGGDDDKLPRQAVSGTVKLDGQPLEAGTIQFIPGSGSGQAVQVGGSIVGGSYEISRASGPVPGTYKVTIFSASTSEERPKDAAHAPDGHVARKAKPQIKQELIPKKYNSETTLEVTVKEGGNSPFNFDLQSK